MLTKKPTSHATGSPSSVVVANTDRRRIATPRAAMPRAATNVLRSPSRANGPRRRASTARATYKQVHTICGAVIGTSELGARTFLAWLTGEVNEYAIAHDARRFEPASAEGKVS